MKQGECIVAFTPTLPPSVSNSKGETICWRRELPACCTLCFLPLFFLVPCSNGGAAAAALTNCPLLTGWHLALNNDCTLCLPTADRLACPRRKKEGRGREGRETMHNLASATCSRFAASSQYTTKNKRAKDPWTCSDEKRDKKPPVQVQTWLSRRYVLYPLYHLRQKYCKKPYDRKLQGWLQKLMRYKSNLF